MNDVGPQAWLADVLAPIADLPQNRLPELLPWNWKSNPREGESCLTAALGKCLRLTEVSTESGESYRPRPCNTLTCAKRCAPRQATETTSTG